MREEVFISIPIEELKDIIYETVDRAIGDVQIECTNVSLPEIMSINQVCEYLCISKVTLHKWKKLGKIPFHRLAGKVYFKKSEVLNHLKPGLNSWQA